MSTPVEPCPDATAPLSGAGWYDGIPPTTERPPARYDSLGRILVERVFAPDRTPLGLWAQDALCAESDPDAWFPPSGDNGNKAKAVCRLCAVTTECLEYALVNNETDGIWGGLTSRQRDLLRRKGVA